MMTLFERQGKLVANGALSEELMSKKAKAAGNAAVRKHFGDS
jgi:hypothetical protein